MEDNWIKDSSFGQRTNFNNAFGYNSEVSLVSQNKLVNIRTRWKSWNLLSSIECSDRSRYFYPNHDVINISILVLFHTWSSGTNPTSQTWKLHWIWFMSTHHSKLRKLFLKVFTNYSSFNTSHHVFLIDPFNFVHSGHINRDYHSFLISITQQSFSHIGSPTIRNKNHIKLSCLSNQELCLGMVCNENYHINCSWEFSVSESKYFL